MRRIAMLLLCAAAVASAQDPGTPVQFVSRLRAQASAESVLLTWRNPKGPAAAKLVYRHTEEILPQTLGAAALIARLEAEADRFEDRPPDGSPYYYAVLLEGPQGKRYELLIDFRNKTSQPVQLAAGPAEEDLAASITQLQAQVVEDAVRLVFRSSRPQRELLLFRSAAPISAARQLLEDAAPVTLGAGAQEYTDYPIPGVETYYAVVDAGLFKAGRPWIVPGDNATTAPVQVSLSVARVGLPQASEPERSPPPPVEAVSSAPPAEISPTEPEQSARPRPEQPPAAVAAGAVPAAPAAPSSPAAPPRPARSMVSPALPGAPRSVPLPYLRFPSGLAQPAAGQAALKPQTWETLERLLTLTAPQAPAARRVEILDEDRGQGAEGQIPAAIQPLQAGRYAEAETALRTLLSVPRSASELARLRFYLGQSLYLQGLYEEAALELLLGRDAHYAQVQPWLEDSFRLMRVR